jgi:predicted signal transduction protein with EAL and GGDEF domain
LTNLANRALFKEQLQQALQRMARGQGFAVLCRDLDRFKAVNDNLGHPVGDALLKQVGERLLSCVCQGDLVARLGGDEFAIIEASARDPNQTESLGAASSRPSATPTISRAMPRDQHQHRHRACPARRRASRPTHEECRLGALSKQRQRTRRLCLLSARDERCGKVAGPLKAICAAPSTTMSWKSAISRLSPSRVDGIAGFEALAHWTHPNRGTLAGEALMLLAEEIGLAVEVAEWTLRRSLAQAAHWSLPVKVAVNIVSLQLRRNLLDLVLQALAASRLPSDRLELEIAESLLMQDNQTTPALLHQLRQLGVRIVPDDFGTGYGSLSYLRSFPFDKVKLDRGLIAEAARAPNAAALVEAIIGLAGKLGMTTLAEGVESAQQLDWMRAHGCTQARGFFFGAGVPAAKIEPMLALGAPRQAA